MSRANDTAFPSDRPADPSGGLTIREHFAAMAMQGLIARGFVSAKEESRGLSGTMPLMVREISLAEMAVRHADKLLAELSKEADDAVHRGET